MSTMAGHPIRAFRRVEGLCFYLSLCFQTRYVMSCPVEGRGALYRSFLSSHHVKIRSGSKFPGSSATPTPRGVSVRTGHAATAPSAAAQPRRRCIPSALRVVASHRNSSGAPTQARRIAALLALTTMGPARRPAVDYELVSQETPMILRILVGCTRICVFTGHRCYFISWGFRGIPRIPTASFETDKVSGGYTAASPGIRYPQDPLHILGRRLAFSDGWLYFTKQIHSHRKEVKAPP